jgi:hypothetical protein
MLSWSTRTCSEKSFSELTTCWTTYTQMTNRERRMVNKEFLIIGRDVGLPAEERGL